MATSAASSSSLGPSLAESSKTKHKTILDLPQEALQEIFNHAWPSDLLALSLVSKKFRVLSAQIIYRTFHIVFTDEEDDLVNSDALASGLETFVTSDYDYAQYLREIILEPLLGGDKGERTYHEIAHTESCPRFLSTLLLLTLRKAKALETFKWDVRIELGPLVFKTLHQLERLRHLHIRMPIFTAPTTGPGISSPTNGFTPPSYTGKPGPYPPGSKHAWKQHQHDLHLLLSGPPQKPSTFSNFSGLESLSILDINTLEHISELKQCIENSSSSLRSLSISFSEAMANKSRKPHPEVHSDEDSDPDDDFGMPPGPPPGLPTHGAADPNGPTKILKAQIEKKLQEGFLGKLFGLESTAPANVPLVPAPETEPEVEVEAEQKPGNTRKAAFIKSILPIAKLLMTQSEVEGSLGPSAQLVLDLMGQAAIQFVEEAQAIKKPSEKIATEPAASTDGPAPVAPGLFDQVKPKDTAQTDPECPSPNDIDIEEPEPDAETASDLEPLPLEVPEASQAVADSLDIKPIPSDPPAVDTVLRDTVQPPAYVYALRTSHAKLALDMANQMINLQNQMVNVHLKTRSGTLGTADFKELEKAEAAYAQLAEELRKLRTLVDQTTKAKVEDEGALKKITESSAYVRGTRGLTLESLSISLIPIKASVLCTAIDLTVLQSITLLNVGPQGPFWSMVARENMASPIALRKVSTDNVTLSFLVLASQLERLDELYLLERSAKARVESTAVKSGVTIDQIRQAILKKHASTLKVLMIKNEFSVGWDLNAKTAILLCTRAKALEELAVSIGVKTMHTLLQSISGLTALRALHIVQFRNEDPCNFVRREFRRFAVDTIAQHPEMELEYLALEDSVECLVRRVTPPKVAGEGKGKEKMQDGKETKTKKPVLISDIAAAQGGAWSSTVAMEHGLTPSMNPLSAALFNDDSDEDDLEVSGKGLKLETIEGMRFCDIDGVKIFEKEIMFVRP